MGDYDALNLPGSVQNGYAIGDRLGYGGFSVVHHCTHIDTGKAYAVKVIDLAQYTPQEEEDDVQKEVRILRSLAATGGPFISIVDEFEVVGFKFIVMGLAEKGDLETFMWGNMAEEEEVADILLDVFTGLRILHDDLGLAHRDIKPDNIFLQAPNSDGTRALIGDFGLAHEVDKKSPGTSFGYWVGTPWYWAPEVITAPFGPASDIWAAGIVMWILLIGNNPLKGITDHPTTEKDFQFRRGVEALKDDWLDELAGSAMFLSEGAWDFVCGLLSVNPDIRLTAQEALDHPFMIIARETRNMKFPPQKATAMAETATTTTRSTVTPKKEEPTSVTTQFPSLPAAGNQDSVNPTPIVKEEADSPLGVTTSEKSYQIARDDLKRLIGALGVRAEEVAATVPKEIRRIKPDLIGPVRENTIITAAEMPKQIRRIKPDLMGPIRKNITGVLKRTHCQVTPKVHQTRAVTKRLLAAVAPVVVPAVTPTPVVTSVPKVKKVAINDHGKKAKGGKALKTTDGALPVVPAPTAVVAKSARDLRAERRAGREVILKAKKGGNRVTKE